MITEHPNSIIGFERNGIWIVIYCKCGGKPISLIRQVNWLVIFKVCRKIGVYFYGVMWLRICYASYDKSFVCSLAERGRLPVETSNECRTYLLNYLKDVNRKINVASNCDLCLMNCCYAENTLYLVKFGRY